MTTPAHATFLQDLMQGSDILPTSPSRYLAAHDLLRPHFLAAYFLADTRPATDVGRFVHNSLPTLLRQLRRQTRHERITYRGQVRGRVDWPATYKARTQNEYNPALYVCRQPQRRNDTPENQLLKFLLLRIDEMVRHLPLAILAAERWTATAVGEPRWLEARVYAVSHHVRQALTHVRLRTVEPPDTITPRHLLKARTAKTELYALVAGFYMQYERVVVEADWQQIRPILRHTLLLPTPDDDLGRDFIRLTAAAFA